jgi:cytochrome P450
VTTAAPPSLDTFSAEYDADIHRAHDVVREQSWCARTPMGYLALRYDDVSALTADPRLREMGTDGLAAAGIGDGPLWDWWGLIMFNREDDEHTRLRRLVSRAFTPRSVEQMRPAVHAAAARLTQQVAEFGQVDFVEAFAAPFSVEVIAHLLGIPADETADFSTAAADLAVAFTAQVGPERARVERGLARLTASADDLIERRRRQPSGDLVSRLIAARDGDDRLSEDELRAMITVLVFGGQDTTQCQLACALATFLDHPDQWALLRDNPQYAAAAAEEVLRFEPAGAGAPRVVTESFSYDGIDLVAGDVVLPSIPGGNRDPRAFDAPDIFDITKARTRSPLTFGGGPHYCLGAALARIELQETLPMLASRLGDARIDGTVRWRRFATIRGPEQLPIAVG